MASEALRQEVGKVTRSLGTLRANLEHQLTKLDQLEQRLTELVGREDREVWVHRLTGTYHSKDQPCGKAPQPEGPDWVERENYELRLLGDMPSRRACRFCGGRA